MIGLQRGGSRIHCDGPLVDVHCHILPGIDDGSGSLEESVLMARAAAEAGVSAIIATPHVMAGVFNLTPEQICGTAVALQAECDRSGVNISILPGSEIYLDESTPALAKQGRLVPVGRGRKHLLLELPHHDVPQCARDILFRVSVAGYTPIIAHPERNATLRENPEIVSGLAASGVMFQLNAGSLLGEYGRRIKQAAERWLADGLYSLIGSDWHGAGGRNNLIEAVRSGCRGIERLLAGNSQLVA